MNRTILFIFLSFTVLTFSGTTIISSDETNETSKFKCPYLEKIHKAEIENSCPYSQMKGDSKIKCPYLKDEGKVKSENKCPYMENKNKPKTKTKSLNLKFIRNT